MSNAAMIRDMGYRAALYMRLSKDDEGNAESGSITNQRKMLQAYANEHHFVVYDEYVDDGISGTTFDRPQFKRMIRDIEAKQVNLVITKDLSRLGRDYILSGQYTEIYFPSKKVRYIAINDGYDSDSPYTDIAPFKNVINEMYARDTSKKIRSAFVTRMQEGAFVGASPPFGYLRDPEDRHHLVVDEVSACYVQEIFQMAAGGQTPAQIAKSLQDREILSPLAYRYEKVLQKEIPPNIRRRWNAATVLKMLHNQMYLGHMVQGKTQKISFKSHATIQNPQEDWCLVKNTHQPLISQEVFDLANKLSHQRICPKQGSFTNIFSGIAVCDTCGRGMSTTNSRKKGVGYNLTCGGYKLYGSKECTNHFIEYDRLYQLVLQTLQRLLSMSPKEQEMILQETQQRLPKTKVNDPQEQREQLEKRSRELDVLVEKLYEDHIHGLLDHERMQRLLSKYDRESKDIRGKLQQLEEVGELPAQPSPREKLQGFLQEYTQIKRLDREVICRLIDRIEIGQGVWIKIDRGRVKQQTVTIHFRFSGVPMTCKIEES